VTRHRRALVASLLAAPLAMAACADVIGLQDRPLRDAGASVDAPVDAANDGGYDAPPDGGGSGFACDRLVPPADFCDDFDRAGEVPGDKWSAGAAGIPSIALTPEAGLVIVDGGSSPPNALFVDLVGSTGQPAIAALANALPVDAAAPPPTGVRIEMEAWLADVTVPTLVDGGASFVPLLVVTARGSTTTGMGLALGGDGIYLIATTDLLNDGTRASVRAVKGIGATATWVHVSLLVAPQAAAVTAGIKACADAGTAGYVVAISMLAEQSCLSLDGVFDGQAWATSAVLLGGAMHGAGTLGARYDNLGVYLLH
jgi:hypothetical protein